MKRSCIFFSVLTVCLFLCSSNIFAANCKIVESATDMEVVDVDQLLELTGKTIEEINSRGFELVGSEDECGSYMYSLKEGTIRLFAQDAFMSKYSLTIPSTAFEALVFCESLLPASIEIDKKIVEACMPFYELYFEF